MTIDTKELTLAAADIQLPKWPQMLTYGAPVTPAQALEIIRRTDTFFASGFGGNDWEWEHEAYKLVDYPCADSRYGFDDDPAVRDQRWKDQEEWRERWGVIDTSYVTNNWAACCSIGGPHGWCHPNGMIRFVNNVGKWPSVSTVAADWTKLVEAFPFLNLTAVLMDRESCEDDAMPLVAFHIQDGAVTTTVPSKDENPFARFNMTLADVDAAKSSIEDLVKSMVFGSPRSREHGLPLIQFKLWGDAFRQPQ